MDVDAVDQRILSILQTNGRISNQDLAEGMQAFVEVRLDRQTTDSVALFEKEILKCTQVLECYLVAGGWDYVLRVVARDLDEFREFCVNRLARIPGVGNVKSNIAMKQVKYSTALPLTA